MVNFNIKVNSFRRCVIKAEKVYKSALHNRFSLSGSLIWLMFFLIVGVCSVSHAGEPEKALLVSIKGPIGPAVSDYFERGLKKATTANAELLILQMDTPGGFDHSMRHIIKNILSSSIPVVSYVAPGGSRAASAGTYILYASHVAAMAPTTNLGAATPVRVGGLPGMPEKPDSDDKKEKSSEKGGTPDALEKKMVNDAVAYIKTLATRYGRNAEWAEDAVREAVSLTSEEALQLGVIDMIAASLDELLQKLNGREVVMETGTITLATQGLTVEHFVPDWRTKLLSVITDPNIAYILMLLGVYGLIYELANPGFILPGIVGTICLLLALYTFQILPINYAGLALMVLGISFMIAEAFVPSFGALGIGGVIAFVVGSIILMDEEGMGISLALIGGTALTSVSFFLWVIGRMVSISRKKVVSGAEEFIGLVGEAMEDFTGEGRVWVHGESWRASAPEPVIKGQKIQVTAIDGLQLEVKPLQEDDT